MNADKRRFVALDLSMINIVVSGLFPVDFYFYSSATTNLNAIHNPLDFYPWLTEIQQSINIFVSNCIHYILSEIYPKLPKYVISILFFTFCCNNTFSY
ncbi:Uncharacterised protein [uncultured archaeon]|nr:Uncharacterised protein [uncultured archaeon]